MYTLEHLEQRRLLSTTPVSAVPAIDVAAGPLAQSYWSASEPIEQLHGDALTGRTYRLDTADLRDQLDQAPLESTGGDPIEILLPGPDRTLRTFAVERTNAPADQDASENVNGPAFRGFGVNEPAAVAHFDLTDGGFHATVSSAQGRWSVTPVTTGKTAGIHAAVGESMHASYYHAHLPTSEPGGGQAEMTVRSTFSVTEAVFGYEQGHSLTLRFDLPGFPNLANVDFSTLDRDDLLIRNLDTGTIYEYRTAFSPWFTNDITFGLGSSSGSALPDGDYRVTVVGEVLSDTGLVLEQGDVLDFFVLAGDANRDRSVDLQDFLILRQNFNATDSIFSQADFNYDGNTDLQDFLILRSNFNKTLD